MSSIRAPFKDIEPTKLLFSTSTLPFSFKASFLEIILTADSFSSEGVSDFDNFFSVCF